MSIPAPICPTCQGERWLCEQHSALTFMHDDECPGPGIPCICNPDAKVEWQEVRSSVDDTGPEIPG
jgi:hypothetical protein